MISFMIANFCTDRKTLKYKKETENAEIKQPIRMYSGNRKWNTIFNKTGDPAVTSYL